MNWTYLGHAMWLAEAGGLRLLFDPVLHDRHHGGVFEVVPRRTIRVEQLQPDFILVSHRHPDHFDPASLHRLAQCDPDAVVVTPDGLVADTAAALGFRTVQRVGSGQHIQLDGVGLITTPSNLPDEWGVMVATPAGVVWNQVDSVIEGAEQTRSVVNTALDVLGAESVSLALVSWCPLLEIAAQCGESTAFPLEDYAQNLQRIAAIGAGAIVPAAAGDRHTERWAWMRRFVHPVGSDRVRRDLAQMCPEARILAEQVGCRYEIRDGRVTPQPNDGVLVDVIEDTPATPFRPLDMPPLRDTNPAGHDEASMRARIEAWIRGDLAQGIAQAYPALGITHALRLVVEVVYPTDTTAHTLQINGDGARVLTGPDDDWDAINAVTASMLWEVIEGQRHWGDVLLAGDLRCRTRAYTVEPGAVSPIDLGDVFLYRGLTYDDSHRNAVAREVAQLTGKPTSFT